MIDKLTLKMIEYYSGDPKRIQHFLKVHSFARLIGRETGLDDGSMLVLEAAAVVHDIGIKNAELKYGSCSGALQEKEGPPEAERLLDELGFAPDIAARICQLVGRHHTYTDIDGPDCQILIEADFLVNLFEDNSSRNAVEAAIKNIFRTEAGTRICKTMFASVLD